MSTPPPGSLGAPFIGETLTFLRDPFEFTLDRTKQHGNIWKTRIMGDTVVFFAGPKAFSFFMDPENFTRQNGSPKFVQEVLHADAVPFLDGDRHRARKRLLLAAFTNEALDSYLPGIFRVLERFVTKWIVEGEKTIASDLNQAAFDIADLLFAAADPDISDTKLAADFTLLSSGAFAPPVNLPFTAYGKGLRARDRMRVYIKNAVATRDGAGSALGVLKTARGANGEQLSAAELEIELLHFYFAAHGGLRAALAWCLVVLGQHPELAARLRTEADGVLRDPAPTLAQIGQLAHARSVMREILRSYPIAFGTFIGIAKKDLEIDGFTIKAGWKGAGAIWPTLQDGAQFADPTAFKGDRLGDDAMKALPDGAFVPQGGGPSEGHRCPGESLVQTILPAFLGWFAKRYDLAFPAQNTSPHGGGLGPMPTDGVRVKITKRTA
jgi:cytochrome P450